MRVKQACLLLVLAVCASIVLFNWRSGTSLAEDEQLLIHEFEGISRTMAKKSYAMAGAGTAAGGAAPLPLGGAAAQMFRLYCKAGMGDDDMSGIIRMLKD